ncbi:MAG TPA: TIGR03618 family F420-dependent PPOX class oxidoreductase [Acidimicrobiia bacterium]
MKIPRDDPRAARIASNTRIDRQGLLEFVRHKHQWILATTRADGRPQMSPVTGGMTPTGHLAIATYPERAKARNARRAPEVSVFIGGDDFSDAWIQIDGTARVLDMPEATDGLVEYYRSISGEHPDWAEYRQAMADQGKCLILVEATRWSPISKGGFPASLFED